MANVDAPFGFRPAKHISGAEWNGQTNEYAVESAGTIIGIGDPVVLTGTANTAGIPTVSRSPVDGRVVGVVVAIQADRENLGRRVVNTGESALLLVMDSPDVICEIQVDSNGIVLNDIGNVAAFVVSDASTTTGKSTYQLNGSNIGTGDDLRIMRKKQIEDNTITTTASEGAFSIVEVLFAKHLYGSRTTAAV